MLSEAASSRMRRQKSIGSDSKPQCYGPSDMTAAKIGAMAKNRAIASLTKGQLTLSDRSRAFSLGLAVLNQFVKYTSGRVRQPSLDSSITLLLQVPRDTCQCSARTCCADECVEISAPGLFPDLRTSGGDVSASVGRVVELVCPDGIVERFSVSRGLVVVVLRVVECDGWVLAR